MAKAASTAAALRQRAGVIPARAVKGSTDAGRRPANTAAGSRQPTSFEEKTTPPVIPDHGESRIHGGGSEAARRSDPSARRTRLWQLCITRRERTPHQQG